MDETHPQKLDNSLTDGYGPFPTMNGLRIIHILRLPKGQRLPDIEDGKIVVGTGTYVPEPEPEAKS
jgi:hypothetical protein